MTEKSGDRLLLTGVSRQDLEFALGFVGISDYKIEFIDEPIKLGLATLSELKEFAAQSEFNPQLATRLIKRVNDYHPNLLTENGSLNLDGLSEAIANADQWFAGGKKTLGFASSFIASKQQVPETE